MKKKITKFLILLVLGFGLYFIGAYIWEIMLSKATVYYPMTYYFKKEKVQAPDPKSPPSDQTESPSDPITDVSSSSSRPTTIWIVGAEVAQSFYDEFHEEFKTEVAKKLGLKEKFLELRLLPEKISASHRLFHYIKSVPPEARPKWLINFPSQSIHLERKYRDKDVKNIWGNIQAFENLFKQSLMYAVPQLSRFIYKKIAYYPLEKEPVAPEWPKTCKALFFIKQINSKLYEYELNYLLTWLNKNHIKSLWINSPMDLKSPLSDNPCTHEEQLGGAVHEAQLMKEEKAQEALEGEDYKTALEKYLKLLIANPVSAPYYFSLARAYEGLGSDQKSYESYFYAHTLDLDLSKPDPLAFHILHKTLEKYNATEIDLGEPIRLNYDKISDPFPDSDRLPHLNFLQNAYYQILEKIY